MSEAVEREWYRHPAAFALRWLVDMDAKGLVYRVSGLPDYDLHERLAAVAENAGVRRIVAKDAHLVEAALETDRTVISLDEQVRMHLAAVADRVPKLAAIIWVNPNLADDAALVWLKRGAKPESSRRLRPRSREGA